MFEIDLKSRKSIYEQVVDNIKELVIRGVLPEDEKLPSVRELSKTLTVNPNTVQKAYRELERQGYIYTAAGLGCFVSKSDDRKADDKETQRVMEELESVVRELMYLGVSRDRIMSVTDEVFKGTGKNNAGGAGVRGVGDR